MNIKTFTNFNKKPNSTKRPDLTLGTDKDVKLKESTSINNPSFMIRLSGDEYGSINYVYWNGAYYYVDDIVYISNDIYELVCSKDRLATYKDSIGSSTQFIERSASSFNKYINDNLLSHEQRIVDTGSKFTALDFLSVQGCYIVRTLAGDSANNNGINMYAMESSEIRYLIDYISSQDITGEASEILVRIFFNPFEYIASIYWVPMPIEQVTDQGVVPVKLGRWSTQQPCGRPIKNIGAIFSRGITLFTPYYNDFRDNNPTFTKYKMFLPCVGNVEIDSMDINHSLQAAYVVDFITCKCTVILKNPTTNCIISQFNGTIGTPIELGQVGFTGDVVGDVLSAGANVVAGNYVTAGTSIIDAVQNVTNPTPSSVGMAGNRSMFYFSNSIIISRIVYGSATPPSTHMGRPLYTTKQINTLSGFIKCGNAAIDIAGELADKIDVESNMNSGFYYE